MRFNLLLLAALTSATINADDLGSATQSRDVTSKDDTTGYENLLEGRLSDPVGLGEVVVTGTRAASNPSLLSQTVTIIDNREIERSLRPSLLPLLSERVAGLFTTSRGVMGYGVSGGAAGGISIRGMQGGSGQVLTLIDGHPQYSGIFGHPISDALQSLMAQRIEVVSGPASTIYGSNAMGGIINVITRQIDMEGLETTVMAGGGSYGTLETSVLNQTRFGRFSSSAGISYNRSDNNRPNMGFSQETFFAKIGYDFSQHWKARADIDLTHFDAENPGPVTNPLTDARQSISRGAAAISVDNRYAHTNGGVSLFFNWGHHWINDGYAAGSGATPRAYRFISNDNMAGASAWQSYEPMAGSVVTAGFDWFRYSGNAWNKFVSGPREGDRQTIVDKWHSELAGYVDLRQEIAGVATVNAGIRIDNNDGVSTEWIPKGGFALNLGRQIGIKGSIAKGFRYPTLREMYMFGAANSDLKPESSLNSELAFSQTLLDGSLDYGVNLFFIDAKNLIVSMPRTDGAGMLNVNTGKVINKGVEARVAYRINSAWSVDANYSYVDMSRAIAGSPTQKLYVGGVFTQGRWTATLGVQNVGRLYTSASPVKTENFVLVNARVEFEACKWLSLWARGENLLAQKYEINAGFPMPRATAMGGVKVTF